MEKIGPQTMDPINENLESPDYVKECMINTDMEKNLLETDLTVESLVECPKVAVQTAENISEVNIDTKNDKVLNEIGTKTLRDEILNVSQTKMDTGSTENLAAKNVNGKRKRRRKKKKAKNKVDTQSMHQVDGMLRLDLSDGNHGEGIDGKLNENDEIIVYTGRCSAKSRSIFSTCDIKVTQHPSSDVNEAECLSKDIGQYPRIPLIPSIKRKLIVLDVNGLLANVIMPAPKGYKEDVRLCGRAIFKRPFCDDFLKFCFQNFDVGVWSSRSKKIVHRVVEYLLGDLNDKLLFCWDMSHSTQTRFRTVENIHKPLVFKELRKIWENDDPNLPWKNGDYNELNTLLLDDSPYKALLNPLHTAIFPNSYNFKDENDNSLGPGGDLRVYLEGLLTSENFQSYVEQHPFGQSAINETDLSWDFYLGVLQNMSNQQGNNTSSSSSLPNLVGTNGFFDNSLSSPRTE